MILLEILNGFKMQSFLSQLIKTKKILREFKHKLLLPKVLSNRLESNQLFKGQEKILLFI